MEIELAPPEVEPVVFQQEILEPQEVSSEHQRSEPVNLVLLETNV
jgi:hypothetical protein